MTREPIYEEEKPAWRQSREARWYEDVGYALETEVRAHNYQSWVRPATKPDDPGWHACTCGWEGYWSGFHQHVANQLRTIVVERKEWRP